MSYSVMLFCLSCWLLVGQEIFAQTLKIENRESYPIYNKNIVINKESIKKYIKNGLYPIIEDSLGHEIPSQTNAVKKWNKLYFQVTLQANATNYYTIKWQHKKPVYPIKTSVRFGERAAEQQPVKTALKSTFKLKKLPAVSGFQPYQTDGPTWENDKVGFRHYLDGRHAKDLFGKLNPEISPENVGLTVDGKVIDNYHVLEKWGRDILPVGNSVGIGGIALKLGDDYQRIACIATDTIYPIRKTLFKILTEGALYSQIQIKHQAVKLNDRGFLIEENPAIWAGSYAYENQVKISSLKDNESLVVGLSNVAVELELKELRTKNWLALYTYGKQSYNREYFVGLAIIVPTKYFISHGKMSNNHELSNSYYATLYAPNTTEWIKYYAMGCWELSDPLFKTQAGFESYLKEFLATLNADIVVAISN